MQEQGSIVRWEAARGFGFIRSTRTQTDVFFHVRDFRGAPKPALRMAVEYEEIHVGGKGPRAMAVRPRGAGPFPAAGTHNPQHHRSASAQGGRSPGGNAGSRASRSRTPATAAGTAPHPAHRSRSARVAPAAAPAAGTALLLVLLAGWLALLGGGLWSGRLPLWIAGALLAHNLLTLWTYAADKNAARASAWRVSENQLHLLSLLGGWPAAWLAQQSLRHKTRKASFRAAYWLTVVVHCGALALWLWRGPKTLFF